MKKEKISLFLVEDNPDDALIFEETIAEINQSELSGYSFTISRAETVAAAKDWLEENEPDLILLDLALPDSSGIETVFKMEHYIARTPVIVLTGLTDSDRAITSIQQGIQDYLVKGTITPDSLFRSVIYAIERHKMMTVMQSLAMVDDLTGLYNRRGFL
ncbi:MAG: response regulator, partial [Spirochaetota bacterium]